MEKVLSVSFGELILKGKNRRLFVDQAIKKIKKRLEGIEYDRLYLELGKLYIEAKEENFDQIIKAVGKVFGIVYICPCIRTGKEISQIEEAVTEEMSQYKESASFKVIANRVDKAYPIKSPELNKSFGGHVLKNFDNFTVDVHKPDISLFIDIKENTYVYTKRFKGLGGLPIGSSGKGLVLLSGGIDSPVAAFMMAKRGLALSFLHFHSYPFTSDRAFEKVKKLGEILTDYIGPARMYSINLLPIQKEINEKCREREMTVLSRRFMMRIGEELCKKYEINCLITGESLGQVASQTIEGITATDQITSFPILRPLIGNDKTEIIEIAEEIGTYETSILPFEDCCTVFLPSRPVTKPRIHDLEASEANLDIEKLVSEALEKMEIIELGID